MLSPRRILASILIAAMLAVAGLRGQTLSLGGSHAQEDGSAHAEHRHFHEHDHESAPAAPHAHGEHGDHVHVTLDDWARTAARAAVELPKLDVLGTMPALLLPDIGTVSGPGLVVRACEPWWTPPKAELAALRAIRLLV